MAYLVTQTLQPSYEEDLFAGESAFAAAVGLNSADDSLPYSTAELNAPEYSTDDFRMFSFKVARCSKRFVHDWRACPFAHPTENARRRDPRLYKYLPVPCPEYKRGICFRGDECPYSHGVYECWLHPAKYRTQLCKEGPQCRRPVCFFAHSVLDLRQPTHMWDGNNYEPQTAATALLQVAAATNSGRCGSEASHMQHLAQQSSAVEPPKNNTHSGSGNNLANGSSCEGSGPAATCGGNGGSSSHGPSSPHCSQGPAGNGTPPQEGSPASLANGAWTPSRQTSTERRGSGEASPTTPSRASSGDAPTRPSAEVGTAVAPPALTANATAASAPSIADMSSVASALAAAISQAQQVQQQQQGARSLARHSADMGARGSGSIGSSPLHPPRMSLDAPSTTATQSGALAAGTSSSRMSFDSMGQNRGAGSQAPPWGPAPGGYAGLQEMSAGTGPRMSNAVARKLGLAPQRTANEARLAKLRNSGSGMGPPNRASLDGLLQALHGGRTSLEQQMVNQHMLAAAGLAQLNGALVMNGGYMGGPAPYPPAAGGGYGTTMVHDPSMGINPALLTVVAAQMGGAVPMPPQGQMPPQNAAAMNSLMDSLHSWNLNGAGNPAAVQQGGAFPGPPSQVQQRSGSFDGSVPHHSAFMPSQGLPTSSPYYLPSELETMMNNNNSSGRNQGGLVNPVGAGLGSGSRE